MFTLINKIQYNIVFQELKDHMNNTHNYNMFQLRVPETNNPPEHETSHVQELFDTYIYQKQNPF